MKIKFKKLYEDSKMPIFANSDKQNAGMDLFAYISLNPSSNSVLTLEPGQSVRIGTGVAWEPGVAEYTRKIGDDCIERITMGGWKPALIIKGRSGLAYANGIEVSNAGVIDAGYRGEINVLLRNNSTRSYLVFHGERIAQGVVVLLPDIEIEEAAELSSTARGDGGFGSTGR